MPYYAIRIPEIKTTFSPTEHCASASLTYMFLSSCISDCDYDNNKKNFMITHKSNFIHIKYLRGSFSEDFIWGAIRNPYDLVCAYAFGSKPPNQISLNWCKKVLGKKDPSKRGWIPPMHKVYNAELDYIVRFENLTADFENLRKMRGWSQPRRFHIHRNNHRKGTDWRLYYSDPESVKLVNQHFEKDFEIFGYKKYTFDEIVEWRKENKNG